MLEIPPLPETTMLLVEVGSTAHGTGLPGGEDHDEMGLVVETANQIFGLDGRGFQNVMHRTQPEGTRSGPGDTDRSLYSLRTFLRLAAGGNPSILMVFWAPVLHSTPTGDALRELGGAFIGRSFIPRYRGYMQGQAERLLGVRGSQGHGRRGGGGRDELIAEHGYDTKYAMHCARLGFQCQELLRTRKLDLPMQGEAADWLRAVRRGDISFEDWWERCLSLDTELVRLAADTSLPELPDYQLIEAFSVKTHLQWWDDLERAAQAAG